MAPSTPKRRRPAHYNLTTPSTRGKMVGMYSSGHSFGEIAKAIETPKSTVRSIVLKAQRHHTLYDKTRSGRPEYFDRLQKRHVLGLVRTRPNLIYRQIIKELDLPCKKKTIERLLRRHEIKKCITAKRPHLTQGHARQRLK